MSWHKEIWTYLIVTLVAVLIWAWAASETRERKTIPSARLEFAVAGQAGDWFITPGEASPTINIEGTNLAVQKLSRELQRPLRINVPVNDSHIALDLAEALRQQEKVLATGATIVSTEPATIDLNIEQIERQAVKVKAILPGVTAEGEVTIQPREVTVSLPRSVRQRLKPDFAIEAAVDRSELDALEPGVPQSLDVTLRFPEEIAAGSDARITPSKARVSFTIRSRIRETLVDSVRVQIQGAAEDTHVTEVEPKVLRGVTLMADADLSRKIESGDVPVIAVVHLRSSEKEAMIDHKEVSYFLAMETLPDGSTRYEQLKIKPGAAMPVINLKITPRAASTS